MTRTANSVGIGPLADEQKAQDTGYAGLVERHRDLFKRLDDVLVEESPMHPFGCSTWEESTRIAIDMAKQEIRDLEAGLAEREGEAVETALAWYGEQARLARLIHSEGDAGRNALAADGGKKALAALRPSTEGGK